ncbi:MAG TPA: periplasmic heavy metal sensor [Thermoanaerobaculia bacterium]|jgi:Spy/CpxP family protein refolding chaperone
MSKRTIVIFAILAVLALAAFPFAYAQGFHRHRADAGGGAFGGMMFFGHTGRVKAALDLSDAQVDQLKIIAKEVRAQNAPYRQQLRDARLQVAKTLLANPNDTAAAQALIDQQTSTERTVKMNVLAGVSKALNVLTPDQRAKASQFLADRSAREN